MQLCRATTWLISRRRFTFVLVGEARYFDVARLKLPNQTFEQQPFWALDRIVVEMSVSGKNYIHPDGGKFAQEPLWVTPAESFRQGSVRTVKSAGDEILNASCP